MLTFKLSLTYELHEHFLVEWGGLGSCIWLTHLKLDTDFRCCAGSSEEPGLCCLPKLADTFSKLSSLVAFILRKRGTHNSDHCHEEADNLLAAEIVAGVSQASEYVGIFGQGFSIQQSG